MSNRQSLSSTFDFITTTHRISGSVQTGSKPLSDVLNDSSQSYLLVTNVYISRVDEPGAIGAYAPLAYLAKENLSFAIASARDARLPERGRFAAQEYAALAGVPGFEVQGTFVGPHRIDLRTFSPAALDAYLVFANATAQNIFWAEVTYSGEVILINRARLESLCLTE